MARVGDTRTQLRYNAPIRVDDDAVLDLVLSRYRYSKDSFYGYLLKTARWYASYRGWYSGKYQQFRNNVILPLSFATIQSDVARKVNTSFGAFPYVNMIGFGQEDASIARQQELLVSAQMLDSDIITKAIEFFVSANLYGTAVCQVGWRFEEEMARRREQIALPITGGLVERVKSQRVTTFDGPDFEPKDILDFFPKPNTPRLKDMSWKIIRYWLDFDDVEALSEGEHAIFDKAAVNELRISGMASKVDDEFRLRSRAQHSTEDRARLERYAKPVQIIEMWGFVPKEFAKNGVTHRVISIANEHVILRNRDFPFDSLKDPFLAFSPILDPHYFHGPSKAEIAERFQVTASRLNNQKLDALDLIIDPTFLYSRDADIETKNLYMRAGKLIGVSGDVRSALTAVFPDTRGVQMAYEEISSLWSWQQQATGIIEDTVMGGGGGDRQTAREFLGRQENISIRLLLESRLAEAMWLEPLCQTYRALNRQFLTVPMKRAILGSHAVIDAVTGQPIMEEVNVQMADLYRDYDARAVGSTQVLPKSAKQQNITLLLQAITAHPLAMQMINWTTFFREMFRCFEFTNVDELMTVPPQQQALMMAQQMQAQNGSAPGEQVPGTPSQTADPSTLSPLSGLEQGGVQM